MNLHLVRMLTSAISVALLLSQCDPAWDPRQPTAAPPPATPVPTATPAPMATPTETPTPIGVAAYQPQTACDHPYWPLRLGAVWTYQVTFDDPSGKNEPYTWSHTVTAVTGDLENASATILFVSAASPGEQTEITATCDRSGIQVKPAVPGMTMSGYTLLAASELVTGASWSAPHFTVCCKYDMDYRVAGTERVSAGGTEFTALRVDSTWTTYPPSEPLVQHCTEWFAYGVGKLRVSCTDSDGPPGRSELISHPVP